MGRIIKSNTAMHLILSVVISYMTAIIILLLVSFLMLKAGIGGTAVSILLTAAYVISPFAGGFYMGKHVERKRYLWGLLSAVLIIAVYLIMVAIIGTENDTTTADYIKRILLMAVGGVLGGMIS